MDTNDITRTLQNEIEDGILTPGTVLKQEVLAARFDVSRQPVRHALERLLAYGLLEKRSDRSLAVIGLSINQVRELAQIRISLEQTALGLSAPKLTPSDLRKARRINEDLYEEDDPTILAELDLAFHRVLYGACGNDRLLAMIADLRGEARRAYAQQPKGSRPRHAFYNEHDALITACTKGDINTAKDTLATHIGVTAATLGAEPHKRSPA
ncbi:MAG: transcriptional regulator [Thalassospira sp.]|uniref:GntR family transcriptional regulator n=1 Tax=Thalassospira sp. GB04J01 TaxID=1485225 RepID=UPI000C0DE8B7|nr:GntR family transcriptional regulator [Thalassospira sp. GB04J01]MBV16773.1 transcriptional regulator [Thalassospira sp.]|tara:strand:+ start:3610 stop:4242 length:633 start_codon:yes stop_codon:yes gene_type:complete